MENLLRAVSHTELFSESHQALDAIKTAAGLTDAQFAALCLPVLRSYADNVQRLPLLPSTYASVRGAWDFGLTAAMVAYRYAGTVLFFPAIGAEERKVLEPQCRFMAFIATLATAVATVVEASTISSGTDEYHPLCVDSTLYTWLSTHQRATFAWRTPPAPLTVQACAAVAAKFIPKGLLGDFDLRVVLMMYEAITPKTTMTGVESTLAKVVRQSSQRVIEHYKEKQAGTFQPEPNYQNVSIADADKLASKMIGAANLKILPNPLEQPETPVEIAGAATGQRPVEAAQSGQSSGSPGTDLTPQGSTASAPAASSTPAIRTAAPQSGDTLAGASKALQDWFSALRQHPNFSVLADQLQMTEEGIVVPLSMLGMFGVSGPSIRKMMDDAGLIVRRSDDARGIILHLSLRDRFVAQ